MIILGINYALCFQNRACIEKMITVNLKMLSRHSHIFHMLELRDVFQDYSRMYRFSYTHYRYSFALILENKELLFSIWLRKNSASAWNYYDSIQNESTTLVALNKFFGQKGCPKNTIQYLKRCLNSNVFFCLPFSFRFVVERNV